MSHLHFELCECRVCRAARRQEREFNQQFRESVIRREAMALHEERVEAQRLAALTPAQREAERERSKRIAHAALTGLFAILEGGEL